MAELPTGTDTVAVFVAREDLAHLAAGLADAAVFARSQAAMSEANPDLVEPEARQTLLAQAQALGRVLATVQALR